MEALNAALGTAEGRLVTLRPLRDAELPVLFEMLGHPDVFSGGWGGGPAAWSPSFGDFRSVVSAWLPWETGVVLAVRRKEDDALVGVTAVGPGSSASTARLRWTALAPRVWGSGLHDEVLLLVLAAAFDHGMERVELGVDVLNARARTVAERIGAAAEGVLRHTGRRADGTWRNEAVYSVLSAEWPQALEVLRERLAARRPA